MPESDDRSPWAWPDGARAAVSLTFDDNCPSHLETAIPMLDEFGLKGTFYLPVGRERFAQTREHWRAHVRNGHEAGNHSLKHPCSRNFTFVATENCLEHYTLDRMEAEVVEAIRIMREGIPEQEEATYCYPCYQDFVGVGTSRQSYVPVIARHFPAGRGWGEAPNHPRLCDLHYLWSRDAHGFDGERLIEYAESAVPQNRWAIFAFHGVGADHLRVEADAFRALLRHLTGQPGRFWIATAIRVAKHIREHRP
jgi:peptidoglycan/xylan/chitin deacetylase (PgdA/CDA1 family)